MSILEWTAFESYLRERMERIVNSDPQVLLETDGGPVGQKADVILATLYGFDDQIDAEWRLSSVVSNLDRPIPPSITSSLAEPPEDMPSYRTATYALQSSWAAMTISEPMPLPEGVEFKSPHRQVRVLWVRYRRKA